MSPDPNSGMAAFLLFVVAAIIVFSVLRQLVISLAEWMNKRDEKNKIKTRRHFITTGEKDRHFHLLYDNDVKTVERARRDFIKIQEDKNRRFYAMQECPSCRVVDYHRMESVWENFWAIEQAARIHDKQANFKENGLKGYLQPVRSIVRVCNSCGHKWVQH